MDTPPVTLLTASGPDHLAVLRELFQEYAENLAVDLCFQQFDTELATLPGDYADPRGALLLALVDGEPAGCCALRRRRGLR